MHNEQSSQEQLVKGLAHRMNNILTLFHGYVGLLIETDGLDSTTRTSLGKIKEGASAASELMNRTHALVRRPKLVPRELDLPFFFGLMKPMFQALCGPRTTLEVELLPGLQPIWVDVSQLKAALMELVRNACEAIAGEEGVVRIAVSLEPPPRKKSSGGTDPNDLVQWISILVIDNGPGVSATTAVRMFDPFYSTRKQKHATGLGLNVAAEAIKNLGGILSHASVAGETRFGILLPMQLEHPATYKGSGRPGGESSLQAATTKG